MLLPTTDYLTLQILTALSIFTTLLTWSRLATTRPLVLTTHNNYNVRPTLISKDLQSNYYTVYSVYAWSFIGLSLLLLFVNTYEHLYIYINLCLTEYYWLYLEAILPLLFVVWLVYTTRALLIKIDSDTFIAVLIIYSCIYYYLLPANVWTLTILLECQGMALLLVIGTSLLIHKDQLFQTLVAVKHYASTTLNTAILLQFWVGFLGAAFLLTAGAYIVSITGAAHWQDLVHTLVMQSMITWQQMNNHLLVLLLLLSILLKTGAFPLHFWKPELYVRLNFTNVFIYAVPYSVAVMILVVFLLTVLVLATPHHIKWLLTGLVILATYILVSLLTALVELKAFIAYTSGLHVVYLYAAMINDRWISASAVCYNIVYSLAALTLFTILLNFKRNNIKYITDLQLLSNLPASIFWLGTALATMAGVPPLLGFWAKFLILFTLWMGGDWLIVLHLLTISMVYMYFYLALYRFAGATNFKSHPLHSLYLHATVIATLGIITANLHITGIWMLTDISNWACLIAQNIYDYA